MRIPLSRTLTKLVHQTKVFAYDKANLQKMVDLRELHELEDSMGFRGQWDSHRKFQITLLKSLGLRPSHSLLELGCGPLTAGIPLISYLDSSGYVGVDIRSSALNLSWREVAKAGLSAKNPRLICSSSFADSELGSMTFDFVYSFSVLFHLSDEILDLYFAAVSRRLKPNGKCIANVNAHIPSDRWLEFPFLKRSVETYCLAASKHGLRTDDLGEISKHGFEGKGTEKNNPLLMFQLARA